MMNFNDPFASNGTKASTPLVSLAEDILHNARTISDYYSEHRLPQPSFELDGPEDYSNDLPEEIHEARARLRGAAADMSALAAGPKQNIMWMVWNYHDVSTLNYVHHFHIAEAVPFVGSVPIEEIAAATNTPVGRLKRILRYLMLHHVFAEPEPGRIAHTPSSRQLVTSDHVRSWVGVRTEETGPASLALVGAAERWGRDAQELEQTPYSLVHSDGKLSRFGLLALPEHRDREIRFGKLMKALQSTEAYNLRHTVDGYAWRDLGADAIVVDVGGNTGATAQALAREYSNLTVVVQDLPGVVEQGRKTLPSDMCENIKFMEYNFLDQIQPVTNAAAYCFRQIFHDWPDKYAAHALQNTARVMKPGQKMVIVDVVMPPPGSPLRQIESQLRRSDMEMMVQFNALEREAADWEALIKRADPRMEIRRISKPAGSANSIIEVVVGADGLSQRFEEKTSLTYGRRDSLLYAETRQMGPSRKDSKTYADAFPAP